MDPDRGVPATQADELPRRRSRGELLDLIYEAGERRRRRRRTGAFGLAAAALVVAVGAVFTVNLPGGTPQHVATRGQAAPPSPGSSTSSTVLTPETTVAEEPLNPPLPTTTTVARTVAPTTATSRSIASAGSGTTAQPTTTRVTDPDPDPGSGPTSTTSPPSTLAISTCVNSTDPACGPFHWQPEPGPNAPLVIDVTATPKAGDARTFEFAVVYSDADAPIVDGCRTVGFGDGESTFTGTNRSCAVAACIVPYGAWTPPSPQAGRAEATLTHTFPRSGTFEVTFMALSRHSLCHDPYSSSVTKTINVVVP